MSWRATLNKTSVSFCLSVFLFFSFAHVAVAHIVMHDDVVAVSPAVLPILGEYVRRCADICSAFGALPNPIPYHDGSTVSVGFVFSELCPGRDGAWLFPSLAALRLRT